MTGLLHSTQGEEDKPFTHQIEDFQPKELLAEYLDTALRREVAQ